MLVLVMGIYSKLKLVFTHFLYEDWDFQNPKSKFWIFCAFTNIHVPISDGSGCQMSGSGFEIFFGFGSGFGIFLWVRVWHDRFGSSFGFFIITFFPKNDPPWPFYCIFMHYFFSKFKNWKNFLKNKCEK